MSAGNPGQKVYVYAVLFSLKVVSLGLTGLGLSRSSVRSEMLVAAMWLQWPDLLFFCLDPPSFLGTKKQPC